MGRYDIDEVGDAVIEVGHSLAAAEGIVGPGDTLVVVAATNLHSTRSRRAVLGPCRNTCRFCAPSARRHHPSRRLSASRSVLAKPTRRPHRTRRLP